MSTASGALALQINGQAFALEMRIQITRKTDIELLLVTYRAGAGDVFFDVRRIADVSNFARSGN